MSAAVPDDMMAIVIPMLYAVTTHCRPASPTLKSDWMTGNATFTINTSRKFMKRPRLVAARVRRCVLVIWALKSFAQTRASDHPEAVSVMGEAIYEETIIKHEKSVKKALLNSRTN